MHERKANETLEERAKRLEERLCGAATSEARVSAILRELHSVASASEFGAPATFDPDLLHCRTISELSGEGLYVGRLDSVGNVTLIWLNDGFEQLTGYSLQALHNSPGRHPLWIADGDQSETLHNCLTAGSARLEYRLRKDATQQRWIREYRSLVAAAEPSKGFWVYGLLRDVTEETHTARALQPTGQPLETGAPGESARFRALMNQASEAIFVIDPATLSVVDANNTACATLGYERHDLLGKAIDSLTAGFPAWAKPAAPGGLAARSNIVEGKHRRRDGVVFPVEWTITAGQFNGSEYMLVVAREIAERKQLEAQLAQTDRLVSVGILAAGVAHEVNNPLAYILNNISYVLSQLRPDQLELCEALREARAGAERVRDIVKDLKTFSRADDPRIQPVDVCAILDSAVKVAHNEIRHRAQLVRKYQTVPPVHASARLGQVFLNLLLNAAHAIDTGDRKSNTISVVVEAVDDEVVVRVADTGVGISEAEQHKIFNPFYTTKPIGVGTGLGLAICSSITASFGGRIEVHSELGRGATFSVYLPAAKHARVAPTCRSSIPPPSTPESLKILVVDDDAFVARSVRRLLSHQHEVEIALSARDALSCIETHSFDLVFCDVMMPEMTGFELHEHVLAVNPTLARRFVFITGGPFTPEAQMRVDALQRHCLQKPFTPASLALALEAVLLDVSLAGLAERA